MVAYSVCVDQAFRCMRWTEPESLIKVSQEVISQRNWRVVSLTFAEMLNLSLPQITFIHWLTISRNYSSIHTDTQHTSSAFKWSSSLFFRWKKKKKMWLLKYWAKKENKTQNLAHEQGARCFPVLYANIWSLICRTLKCQNIELIEHLLHL